VNDDLLRAVLEAAAQVRTLAGEGARPGEALARLKGLQAAYPALGVDLLWEEETYDASVHYDVLVHRSGEGTVSVSYSPDRGVPWPLRGVHRWREGDLVRVNETFLTVERAVANLDFIWDQAPIVERLVNACLIDHELTRNPIELPDEEIQRAMDGFRRARRLYRAEDTHCWLEQRGLTPEALESLVTNEVLVAHLRERVTDGQVEGHFAEHERDFDTARIARFEMSAAPDAASTATSIRDGRLDFYAAAERQALVGDGTGPASALFEIVRRGEVSPELAAAVFGAEVGQVVGPVATEGGFTIVRILDLTPARLDAPTRRAIERRLFDAWLEARRRDAQIEWFWGHAAQTTPAA
jgi:putative peptide maturation system protein